MQSAQPGPTGSTIKPRAAPSCRVHPRRHLSGAEGNKFDLSKADSLACTASDPRPFGRGRSATPAHHREKFATKRKEEL